MRFLILATLAITLVGCADLRLGPPLVESHPFAATKSIEEFLGRSAKAGESADAKLADLAAKVERTNDLLAELVDSQKVNNGQQCDLLDELKSVKASPQVPPEPPKAITRKSSAQQQNPAVIRTKDGKQWLLSEFLASYYRYPVGVVGMTVDTHLRRDHGVSYAANLPLAVKEQLHAASHEYEKANKIPREAPKASTLVSSDCPNGQCPLQSRTVTAVTPGSTRLRSTTTYSPPAQSCQSPAPMTQRYSWNFSSSRCNGRRCRR